MARRKSPTPASATHSSPIVLNLGHEQTIYQAAQLYQELQTALQQAQPLYLELSELQEVDSALLQILLWAAQQTPTPRFSAPSPALYALATSLGLQQQLAFDTALACDSSNENRTDYQAIAG